jgi:multidrug efflux system membrane fusion protein
VQTSDAGGIVVITQLQPISVIFTLPEDNLREVLRRLRAGATLQVTAFDRTGTTKLDTGHLETVDNQIDTSTGTVKLRAVFDNPEQILFPNQFVNVQLLVNTLQGVTVIPTAAVQRGAPGTFVYLVKPGNTVAAQPVTLGPADDQRVAVTKGLAPGQIVVTDGADRLKDGATVRLAGADGQPGGSAAKPAAAAGAAKPVTAGAKAPTTDRPRGQGRDQRGSE